MSDLATAKAQYKFAVTRASEAHRFLRSDAADPRIYQPTLEVAEDLGVEQAERLGYNVAGARHMMAEIDRAAHDRTRFQEMAARAWRDILRVRHSW